MGAGASSRECDRSGPFELPVYTIAELERSTNLADGTMVHVCGHVECLGDVVATPFHETPCVAAQVVGAMALWKPQSVREVLHASRVGEPPTPKYHSFTNVLRASKAVSFALRDPPSTILVESPDNQLGHMVTHEGRAVRVVVQSTDSWEQTRPAMLQQIDHRHSAELRYHEAHGVLIDSKWELTDTSDGLRPTARLISPGRVAPRAHAFWNEHSKTWMAKVERWNAIVTQSHLPRWLCKYKVTERTVREGDSCCVVGELRRTASGLELHCGEKGLQISNGCGAARSLPPRAR
jgi:hypothetical protein